jgi:hypothetical protein
LFLSAHFGYSEAKQLRDKVGGELGVDAVVGLQALTKPIMIKLTQEAATKHSVVKALNKLYKRNIPIPKKVKDVTEEEELDVSKAKGSDAEMNDQINAQDANPERNQQYTSEQHAAIQTGVPQNTDKASSPSPSGASLDFSQTNWSNKN